MKKLKINTKLKDFYTVKKDFLTTYPDLPIFECALSKINAKNKKFRYLKFFDSFLLIFKALFNKSYHFYQFLFKKQENSDTSKIAFYDFQINAYFKLEPNNQKEEAGKRFISFTLVSGNKKIELGSKNNEDLRKIFEIFKKKISLECFHQFFKPLKKIGKGNFASVSKKKKNKPKSLIFFFFLGLHGTKSHR